MRRRAFSLIVTALFFVGLGAQNYLTRYNLGLKLVYDKGVYEWKAPNWDMPHFSPGYEPGLAPKNDLLSYLTCRIGREWAGQPFGANYYIQEPIYLGTDVKGLHIPFSYSTHALSSFQVKFYWVDPCTDRVDCDTETLPVVEDYNDAAARWDSLPAQFLYIYMEAAGEATNNRDDTLQGFSISGFPLHAGEKFLNREPAPQAQLPTWEAEKIVALEKVAKQLAAPRILALGTTMKHSLRSVKAAYDLTRRRIEAGGCRTVVLGRDMSRILYLNRYVAGDSRFPRSLVVRLLDADYSHIAAEKEQLLAFLDWARSYNEGRSDKVRLIGGDLLSEHNALNGFDFGNWGTYFERFRDTKSAAIDSLVKMATGESYPSHLAPEPQIAATDFRDFIQRHDGELAEVLGGDEVRLIRYFFEHTGDYQPFYVDFKDVERRYNGGLTFIVDSLCGPDERVTLLAPLEHLHFSRTVRPWLTSAGRLLRARHGADYACWALLTGQESRTIPVYPAPREDVETLGPAREGSLEQLLGGALDAPAFVPASAFEGVAWVRCFDSYQGDRNHYDPVCPPRAFDGVVWCR